MGGYRERENYKPDIYCQNCGAKVNRDDFLNFVFLYFYFRSLALTAITEVIKISCCNGLRYYVEQKRTLKRI